MNLSKIEITYFRCFESLVMELQPDINVIVGANGAGKSSILDAIAIALYQVIAANGAGGNDSALVREQRWSLQTYTSTQSATDPIEGRQYFVQVQSYR